MDFADDGTRVLQREIDIADGSSGPSAEARDPSVPLEIFYELERTAAFVRDGGFLRVALQFPDNLLHESAEVLWRLQTLFKRHGMDPLLFVSGDTSYGACCVDEISAQHFGADAIVHYGRACLTPTAARIPVLFVFGAQPVDVAAAAAAIVHVLEAAAQPPIPPATEVQVAKSATTAAAAAVTAPLLKLQISDAAAPVVAEGNATSGTEVVGMPLIILYDVAYAHSIANVVSGVPEPLRQRLRPGRAAEHCCCRHTAPSAHPCSSATQTGAHEESGTLSSAQEGTGCCGGRCGVHQSTALGWAAAPAGQEQEEEARACQHCGASGNHGSAAARSPLSAGHAGNDIVIVGLTVQGITEAMLHQCSVLYIGGEGRRLSNVLMRCAGCVGRWSYDPRQPGGTLDGKQRTGRLREEVAGANRDLMRRYHQIQRAKEASVIGIVGAGMGVAGSSDIMRSLRAAVEDAGRKAYTFAVGRVNAAKLGNFAGVEAFCLVACAESSLLDTHDFPVPIVTPLELQIALGLREWDGFYSTDISDLARNPLTHRLSASSDGDPDAPFFSLVSGGYRGVVGDREVNNSGQEDAHGVLSKFVSPAAEFLMSREYRGLERKAGESEVHAAVDGAVGIASDYGGV
eukprot:TRINITY_DN231_c0_g1_i1.p1 TRINITY_DN231_c0_g1~~TRINITY_DN231_c0_g1_i1.p1  ORF type:complete len:629 (-),score=84.78 TRINITY_DN231_c0_g1_i1:40-1926(-)